MCNINSTSAKMKSLRSTGENTTTGRTENQKGEREFEAKLSVKIH
jgi:hypothetical protein